MPKSELERPYLAFDFGAESGRAVLARFRDGVLTTEEVHRFPNEPVEYARALHWDVPRLWFEVRKALVSVDKLELAGIGVDAWGVDYALLGEQGELVGCSLTRIGPRLLFQIRAGPDFAMIRALAELTLTCNELMESSKRPCFERQTGYTTMESFRD